MSLDAGCESGQAGQVVVVKATQLAGKALSNALDVTGTGHSEAKSAFGPVGQPLVLVFAERSIRIALLIGKRCQHEPVGHGWSVGKLDCIKR